jgi:hypothetical protein
LTVSDKNSLVDDEDTVVNITGINMDFRNIVSDLPPENI